MKARRRPSKAQVFRRIDKDGAPLSWGFEMWNGAGDFLLAGDRLTEQPQRARLAMWRDIAQRYLGRGKGWRGSHA